MDDKKKKNMLKKAEEEGVEIVWHFWMPNWDGHGVEEVRRNIATFDISKNFMGLPHLLTHNKTTKDNKNGNFLCF